MSDSARGVVGYEMWGGQQAEPLKEVWGAKRTAGSRVPCSGSQVPWSRKLFGACASIGVGKLARFLVCEAKHSHFTGSTSIPATPSGKVGWTCSPVATHWTQP